MSGWFHPRKIVLLIFYPIIPMRHAFQYLAQSIFTVGIFASMSTSSFASESTTSWKLGEPIVSFWAGPIPITDSDAKLMAEGHWNLVPIAVNRGRPKDMSAADFVNSQLDILQRYGLRGNLSTWNTFDLDSEQGWNELDALVQGVKNHPALYAYNIKDEPGTGLFPILKRIREFILERDSKHLIFTNLYPIGASNKQLGLEGSPEIAYRAYLGTFLQELQPRLLSYDHYHFGTTGDGKTFFLNLALVRQAALDANIPFMVIVQACSWTSSMRIPTGEELRWLTYVTLAYGAQGIAHYVYGWPGHDGGMIYPSSVIGTEGRGAVTGGPPTPLYYFTKELNKEFVAVARELGSMHSLGAYHVGTIPEGGIPLPEDAAFQFDPPVPTKELKELVDPAQQKLSKAEIEALFDQGGLKGSRLEGYLVGMFGESQTPTHALVVNLDYRTFSGSGHARKDEFLDPLFGKVARQALVGPGKLEVFNPISAEWTAVDANRVELNLPPGAGLLVRLAP